MAKNKVKPTKENTEVAPIEKSDEVLTVVKNKPNKADKAKLKDSNKKKDKNSTKKKAKNEKPKRSFLKGVFSELKKVSWPTFMQALKQTGTVLVVVAVFMVVVLGIDVFLSWLMSLVVG